MQPDAHAYSNEFFDYINRGSIDSARVVTALLIEWLKPESVLDVGCGAGAWCRVWMDGGVRTVVGVDGTYVDMKSILIPESSFVARDLSRQFHLDRRFDIVVSLEVAEHIPGESADVFVDNLARHGDIVYFSAAVPGQGGEFHVNEQPLEYWRAKFFARGYRCYDPIRQPIRDNESVEPWYRYNSLLYANERGRLRLPNQVADSEIAPDTKISDLAPLSWRTRNAVIRTLPTSVSNMLVKVKHSWIRRRNLRA